MKAMIFAAGYGKRLLPLTRKTPKPLVRVQNRAILDWILEQLARFGIRQVIINTHYLAETIEQHIKTIDLPLSISLSHEPQILGTGGGLAQTIDFWDEHAFYLCNSDILCTADLNHFFEAHQARGSLATLAINHQASASMLLIDEAMSLVGIRRQDKALVLKEPKGMISAVGFCGFHAVSPAIFQWFDSPVAFSIIDEYLKIIRQGGDIAVWDIKDAYWIDIGSREGLENANRHFPGFKDLQASS